MFLASCSKKNAQAEHESSVQKIESLKIHTWYAFTENGYEQVSLPQNARTVVERPWTEAVRISSAASAIQAAGSSASFCSAYALVNKMGLLAFNGDDISLYRDDSLFENDTADSIVFSDGMPVFYLFRSTFFNENLDGQSPIHKSRPFLITFNPSSRIFYPLVSYDNLHLSPEDQISGFFWDGDTWACASKKAAASSVEFSYFYWQPLVPLASLNPALGDETFLFNSLTEEDYKNLSLPKLWSDAPKELACLLSSISSEYSFYVVWRDFNGTSPISYCQMGVTDAMLNAHGGVCPSSGYSCAVFSDGTTYLKRIGEDKLLCAFRLPLLPSGFVYGEEAISGNTLYVSWEENSFFKTGRAGFIAVNLESIVGNGKN